MAVSKRKTVSSKARPNKDIQRPAGTSVEMKGYSGPLPQPDIMADYQEINQNFPERIMAMAEAEQLHRHSMDSAALKLNEDALKQSGDALKYNYRLKRLELFWPASVTLVLITAGAYLVSSGKDIGGYATMLTAGAALVGAYLKHRSDKKKKASEKQQKMVETEADPLFATKEKTTK